MPRPSIPGVLLAVVVLLAACLPGQHAPNVAPGHTLELGATPPPQASPGAFGVAFAAPQGETLDPSEVTLVFNRPMRPLETADDAAPGASTPIGAGETPSPARIVVRGSETPPRGSWRWMGTSALVFSPESRLPSATEYLLTVPAGTRSLSGETLAAPFESSFSTPRPHAERLDLDPDRATDRLEPGETFALRFNQPVDPREVERSAALTVGEGSQAHRIPFAASRPDAKNGKLVKIVPVAPLPLAAKVSLVLDASLRGTEGPLSMKEGHTFEMATYGPLAVKQVTCWDARAGRCRPGVSLQVELTGRVTFAELRSHLRITPRAEVAWSKTRPGDEKNDSFSVPAVLRAGASYRVGVTAGMRDEHGQALAHDVEVPLDVDDLAPSVTVGIEGTVLEAASIQGRSIPVTSVNTGTYALAAGAIDPRDVAALVAPPAGAEETAAQQLARVSAWPGMHVERVTPGAARNVSTARRVAIEPLLAATGGRGAFVVATERELRVANVTDLAITAKMSRFGSLVWVTRLSNGQPVAGAAVSIGDATGTLFETRSDADGLAAIPADRYAPADDHGTLDDGRLVYARLGDDWTWRGVEDLARWGSDGPWVDASGGLEPMGMLFTDRGVYRPGETVELEAIFRLALARGMETPAGRSLTLRATDAQGDSLFDAKRDARRLRRDRRADAAAADCTPGRGAHRGHPGRRARRRGERHGAARGVQGIGVQGGCGGRGVVVDAGRPRDLRRPRGLPVRRADGGGKGALERHPRALVVHPAGRRSLRGGRRSVPARPGEPRSARRSLRERRGGARRPRRLRGRGATGAGRTAGDRGGDAGGGGGGRLAAADGGARQRPGAPGVLLRGAAAAQGVVRRGGRAGPRRGGRGGAGRQAPARGGGARRAGAPHLEQRPRVDGGVGGALERAGGRRHGGLLRRRFDRGRDPLRAPLAAARVLPGAGACARRPGARGGGELRRFTPSAREATRAGRPATPAR